MSGFTVWPRAGGLDDQDPLLVDDLFTCLQLVLFQRQDLPGEDDIAALPRFEDL